MLPFSTVLAFPLYEDTDNVRAASYQLFSSATEVWYTPMNSSVAKGSCCIPLEETSWNSSSPYYTSCYRIIADILYSSRWHLMLFVTRWHKMFSVHQMTATVASNDMIPAVSVHQMTPAAVCNKMTPAVSVHQMTPAVSVHQMTASATAQSLAVWGPLYWLPGGSGWSGGGEGVEKSVHCTVNHRIVYRV